MLSNMKVRFIFAALAALVRGSPLPEDITGKRGIPFSNASYANLFQGYSQVNWAYNWGTIRNGLSR